MVIKVFFGPAAVACALFSAGCSSDQEPANGGTGGTSGGGAGGSAGSDAGEDAGPLTTNPFILSTSVFLKNGNTNLVFVNHIAEPGKRCAQRKSGACQVMDCIGDADAGEPEPPGVPAGEIELARGSEVLLSREPAADGTYPVTSNAIQLWSPGESLTLRAAGDVVPAFFQTLMAPGPIELDSMLPDAGLLSVKRGADFPVKWKTTSSEVTITLTQYPPSVTDFRDTLRIVCQFPGASGQGVIPKDVMEELKPSAGFQGMSQFNYGGSASADVTAGGYSIRAYALRGEFVDMIVEE